MSTRFVEGVKDAFSFLQHRGFCLVEVDPARLHYESLRAFVTIVWDVRSGELNLYFGLQPRNGETRDAYSLTDLLDMEDMNLRDRKMPFQVAEESNLRPFIGELAKYTQDHAQLALAGDRMFFQRLKAFRNARAKAYMRHMDLQRARADAEEAWKKRELEKLIALYTSIEDQLTASEKAKLAYAKKHKPH